MGGVGHLVDGDARVEWEKFADGRVAQGRHRCAAHREEEEEETDLQANDVTPAKGSGQ